MVGRWGVGGGVRRLTPRDAAGAGVCVKEGCVFVCWGVVLLVVFFVFLGGGVVEGVVVVGGVWGLGFRFFVLCWVGGIRRGGCVPLVGGSVGWAEGVCGPFW